ncbi:MAG TPA: potassium transporter Kup [Polyangiaceae bacterium]|jgi:KUP system potassium uptake protein|nr:potassium transporter Kup [Polyangiaceae bacterium]
MNEASTSSKDRPPSSAGAEAPDERAADPKASQPAPKRSSPPAAHGAHESSGAGHGHGHADANLKKLAFAALGVVYGDIGTSPLYALKECVHGTHAVAPTHDNVLGLLSLMFWSVTLVVTIKYLSFIMRADNQGEGGVLALLALLPENEKAKRLGKVGLLAALVIFGACLLYGDGIITPAISVLSAVEGLEVATDSLKSAVVPLTVVILFGLFAIQKKGTGLVGALFGPVMVVWFFVIGGLGIYHIAQNPKVLFALNPLYAVHFFRANGFHGFTILASVVLCITGGEALYADMGHFGRKPIQVAWYSLVMPALVLCYFGQGAMLTAAPASEVKELAENPFFALVPKGPLIYPLVALATAATVIASQALISGAYSLTRQAVQLGYLPRVTVTHTSHETEGQIYIPEVNSALAIGCIGLVLAFRESTKLAAAYGIAVTGTMGITTVAYYIVARERWKWSLSKALPLAALFLFVDLAFFSSNALKFFDGGFVPIVVALGLFFTMRVWKKGRYLLGDYFRRAMRPLEGLLDGLRRGVYKTTTNEERPVVRVPGVAVFLTSNAGGTPPLLLHHVRHNKALHDTILLVTVMTENIPRVPASERVKIEPIELGFHRVKIRVGFMETPHVPRALEQAVIEQELPFDLDDVTYYLGRETLLATSKGEMGARAEQLFAFLTRNSQAAARYFGIPAERVVEIGMQIDL